MRTTNNGTVCYDADFDPFGGERAYINNCPSTNVYTFEGKERDTETGNDDFGARYYSNRFGRWLSADWSAVPAPVPYANFTNPQTLNLYSMVADDPESFADLDGHCNDNDWCGSIKGIAVGTWNFVKGTVSGAAVSAIPVYGPMRMGQAAADSVITAGQEYYNKGISGVANELLDQGVKDATAIVTESVLTGGLSASGRVDAVTPERWGVPDANVVVRGGQAELPTSGTYSGAHGPTLEDAGRGVPNSQIRASTAGAIRDSGGSVRSAPEPSYAGGPTNVRHVNIQGGQETFGAPQPNPAPKAQRVPTAPKPPKKPNG